MVRRKPSEYNWRKLQFDETILKKHFTSPRRMKIAFVVFHHPTVKTDGKTAVLDACYRIWQNRPASAHYAVEGKQVRQYVWDGNAAWATANTLGNHAGISVEVANLKLGPSWEIDEESWETAAMLAAFIHVAYGLGRPTSKVGGRLGTLRQHSWFSSTACPGPHMKKIWPQVVAETQRQYDLIVKQVTPPSVPVKKPKPPKAQQARWLTHAHLNTWGDDGAKGTSSFKERLPHMLSDLAKEDAEIITLNEVRDSQITRWVAGLEKLGYDVPLAKHGNLVAVPKGTKIDFAGSAYLPAKVQGKGRKEAIGRVRARINGHWIHIGVSHFDYRNEKGFDELRVKQAISSLGFMGRFSKLFKLPTWRTTFAADTNSNSWVTERAMMPRGFKAVVSNWVDAIYSKRPAIDSNVRATKSDHKIISVTYGKSVA